MPTVKFFRRKPRTLDQESEDYMQAEIQRVLRACPPNWEFLRSVTKDWTVKWYHAAISRQELHPQKDGFDDIRMARLQTLLAERIAEDRQRTSKHHAWIQWGLGLLLGFALSRIASLLGF